MPCSDSDQFFPCLSDGSCIVVSFGSDNLNVDTIVFSDALININANGPVEGVDSIVCNGLCQTQSSDPLYYCQIVEASQQAEQFLSTYFSDISDISDFSSLVSQKCSLTYTGPVRSSLLTVDLNNCKFIFTDFYVPC